MITINLTYNWLVSQSTYRKKQSREIYLFQRLKITIYLKTNLVYVSCCLIRVWDKLFCRYEYNKNNTKEIDNYRLPVNRYYIIKNLIYIRVIAVFIFFSPFPFYFSSTFFLLFIFLIFLFLSALNIVLLIFETQWQNNK